mgnify:CR=1 FL=1
MHLAWLQFQVASVNAKSDQDKRVEDVLQRRHGMHKVCFLLFLSSFLFSKESYAYVYLLPFDNIQNDPAVEWIAAGLSDMVREEIKNVYGVRVKTKENLETIMKNGGPGYPNSWRILG